MKYLVKGKRVLVAILSMVVLVGAAIPVNAASADVNIEIKATDMNMSVTVPSTLPIVFNEDGTNTFPSNWTIENVSSLAGIHLSTVDMNANSSGWKLVKESSSVKTQTVNGKAIKFFVGVPGNIKLVQPSNGNESETGTTSFGNTDICIAAGETKELTFAVERGAFTTPQSSEKAFDMVLTFEFM